MHNASWYTDDMEKNAFLLINNISVSVIDKPVLYDINLRIASGTIYAIMGPNGSGKSSLAYALMGLAYSYHFSIRVKFPACL